jgi:hypothetical protein
VQAEADKLPCVTAECHQVHLVVLELGGRELLKIGRARVSVDLALQKQDLCQFNSSWHEAGRHPLLIVAGQPSSILFH